MKVKASQALFGLFSSRLVEAALLLMPCPENKVAPAA